MFKCVSYTWSHFSKLREISRIPTVVQPVRHTRYGPIYLDPIFDKDQLNRPLHEDDPYKYQPIKAAKSEETSSLNRDPLIQKFIRHILREGDKEVAHRIIDKTFENIKYIQLEKYHKAKTDEERNLIETNPKTIFYNAVENTKPLVVIREIRRGGVMYKVPVPVTENYKIFRSFQWLIESANDKDPNVRVWTKLAYELLEAANNEGKSIRKKNELHRICEENKAYAHFR